MTKVSKGFLAKQYAYNLVKALLIFASNQNSLYAVQKIKVEWLDRNQLYVTGVSLYKKGKESEVGTTLKILRDLIQNNSPKLITYTEAETKNKDKSEKEIEIYIIEQIRNSIRYLEELKLLKDIRPRNRQGKVAGTPYWKFKLINLKDKDVTLSENLEKVSKKLELSQSDKYLFDTSFDTSAEETLIVSSSQSEKAVLYSCSNILAQQMRRWFETLGYRFEMHQVNQENHFEWIINIPGRRNPYDRILVCGMTGEVGLKDVRFLCSKVEEQLVDKGWLVTDRRISKAARSEIEKKEYHNLECFTFEELVTINADFSGYIDWLEAEIKRQGIDKNYVALACTKEELDLDSKRPIGVSCYTEEDGWIEGYIDRWLDDRAKEHISVLGEFGTGKTWFALHYAWVALQRYKDAQRRSVELPRLPLVISLRDYAKAASIESLFIEFFRQYKILIPNLDTFKQLNGMGKLLLIFDGFDEMASRVNRQKMINNFWELAKVVVPGAKVILTCRREHFPEAREGRALLNAELRSSVAHLSREAPQFEVLELEKFNNEQIRQVLSHQAQDATIEKVMGNSELLDLARRPVMTEFILEALPDIEAGKPIDISRVYLYAVKRKMERDIKAERTFTSLADKLYFLCELSWEMLSTDQMSLNYRQFPDRIRRLFGATVQKEKDLDHWHYDMMGQTMLIRNDDGDYKPAHRSLLEFFVAYKFAAELGVLDEDFTELARQQRHLNNNSAIDYTWSSYFHREMDATPLQRFISEPLEKLLETVGKTPLTKAVMDLLIPMVGDNQNLIKVLTETREKTDEQVGYVGGNAATLTVKVDKEALQGRDLSSLTIKGADFSGAILRSVNFVGTNFTDCVFTKIFDIVYSVAFSPASINSPREINKVFATGDVNGVVSLWDVTSGREVLTCLGHSNSVFSVTFSPDGSILASASRDKTVRLWDINSGECLQILEGHTNWVNSVAFSPDGTILASCSRDKTVRLWDFNSGKCVYILKGHSNWVHSVVWSPQGDIVASSSRDRTIRLWNPKNGEFIYTLEGHNSPVFSIAFSPDGKTLASASDDKILRLWNLNSRECLHILHKQSNSFSCVTFSPDGATLASGGDGKTVQLWDISSGKYLHTLEGHSNWVYSVAWSPEGDTLVSSSRDQTVKLWDSKSGKCLRTLQGHTSSIYSVAWSPEGDTLVSSSGDTTLQVWNIKSDKCFHALRGNKSLIYSVAWSPQGNILAIASNDQKVRLWELTSGEFLHTLKGHRNKVRFVTWSPQGDIIASASDDQTVRLWEVSTGKSIHTLQQHTSKIRSVVFSPDGTIVASGSDDQTIRLWDISSGNSIHTLQGHTSIVRSVDFSPQDNILASSSDDQTIRLWDISSGECIQIFQGHSSLVCSVVFSPDGKMIASGSEDQTVRLWELSSGNCVYILEGHTNWIRSVAWSPHGNILASGSEDGTVKFWNVGTGECVKTLQSERPLEGMNISGVKGLNPTEISTLKALGSIITTSE